MSPTPDRALLHGLPTAGREAVLEVASPVTWAARDVLTRDGENASSLILLTSGHVVVRLTNPDGESVTLSVLGRGDVLGEVGLLNRGRERTADAVAQDEVTALVVRHQDFDRIRRRRPEVTDFVLELMARRIDRLSHRVVEAYHVPADTRVARRLYEVSRLYAGHQPRVVVPLTQQDIAGLAGTTRPTANEVLRRFEAAGIIVLGRGRVDVVDLGALRARCS